MKAVVVREDRSLVWDEVPDPTPAPEEALLRIHATAVNRADLLQRRGLYPPPPGAPPYLGLEAAGTVEQAPENSIWKPGDAACCLLGGGGYAQKVAVHPGLLLPVPRGLSLEQAAALPEVFATAYLNLILEAGLRDGETVLIHAGASGVGTAAIQLARQRGARVIATVGSAEKAALVRELGAQVAINYRTEEVAARLRIASDHGVDVVLDCLGGEELGRHLPLLNTGGRWVVIALMKGRETAVDLRPLLSKRLRLIGSTLRGRSTEEKTRVMEGLAREVWPLIESGAVRPVIHAVVPIEQADQAHEILERRENIGKVVLAIGRNR